MIFASVIKRYVHMGTAQYLRDFRRSYDLKKTAELRKRVLQRQKKNDEKTDSVPFKVGRVSCFPFLRVEYVMVDLKTIAQSLFLLEENLSLLLLVLLLFSTKLLTV